MISNVKLVDQIQTAKEILIVEDDLSVSRVLSTVLKQYGKTVVVDGGLKAIELLKTKEFDLILTDYEMPRGSGLDLLDFMSKNKISTPTVMVTAFGTKELIAKSVRHHIFGFIEKPFTQGSIDEVVREALSVKEEEAIIKNLALLGTEAGEIIHEISNPLTVLEYQVYTMKGDQQSADLEKISETIEKIKKIFFSTGSRIRPARKTEFVEFNFSEAVFEAEEEFRIRARRGNVKVSIEGDFSFQLFGDKDRIRQVIVNLVNNAIDAAAETDGRWVKVSIDRVEEGFHFRVTDSGSGIPEESRKKLFQLLFSTKGSSGTGIGLSVAKKIAKEHQGDVFVNHDTENTQFVLFLPNKSAKSSVRKLA